MYHGRANEGSLRPLFSSHAVLAFLVTIAVSEAVGEVPPLSRLQMYSELDPSRTSAVLQLRADGEPVDPTSLERFSGDALSELAWPEGVRCSMRWYRDETRTYVLGHRAQGGAAGPVVVEWGYVVVGWRDGQIRELEPFVALARGNAWSR